MRARIRCGSIRLPAAHVGPDTYVHGSVVSVLLVPLILLLEGTACTAGAPGVGGAQLAVQDRGQQRVRRGCGQGKWTR